MKFGNIFLIIILNVFKFTSGEELSYQNVFKSLQSSDSFLKDLSEFAKENVHLYGQSCVSDLTFWFESLPKTWTLKMFDSYGKLQPAILKGNFYSLGNYHECVRTQEKIPGTANTFKGKYCMARYKFKSSDMKNQKEIEFLERMEANRFRQNGMTRLTNMLPNGVQGLEFNYGICMPASCSNILMQDALRHIARSRADHVDNGRLQVLPGLQITVPEEMCNTDEAIPLTPGDWGAISVLIFFGLLVLMSTAYDLYWRFVAKKSKPKSELLTSFSVYSNSVRLFTPSTRRGPLSCLDGIRVLSMSWVILTHRLSADVVFPIDNLSDLFDWLLTFRAMPIVAAAVSVDSFFILSGLLVAYVTLKKVDREKSFNILTFYLHRLLRILPAMCILVLLAATLYKHIGTGPLWKPLSEQYVQICRTRWWTTILFVNIYTEPDYMCLDHTWYLSVDMQLFLLSPILLYPLMKKPKLGIANAVFWIVASIVTVLAICIINEWPGAQISLNAEMSMKNENRIRAYYYPVWMRASPWLIGFLVGYLLYRTANKKIVLNKYLVLCGWVASLAMMGAVIFGMQPLMKLDHEFSHAADTMYLTFHRVAWAVALLWVVVACAYGYGGPVNWFLSLKIFEILGRFSYSMYLTHLIIQMTLSFMWTFIASFDILKIVHEFLGDLVWTFIFGFVLCVTFESPIGVIEKILLDKKKKPSSNAGLTMNMERGIQSKNTDLLVIEEKYS